jgi:hypothetical protein
MSGNADYLPRRDVDLLEWVRNFLAVLVKILARIGFPGELLEKLDAMYADFLSKYNITESPATRTKVTTVEKNTSRATLLRALRQAIGEYLTYNHNVTDSDRTSLGLPVYKTTRTPAKVADTYPDSDVDSSLIRRLIIRFYDHGKKTSKAKPEGQHGAELYWVISDMPVVSVDELIHSAFSTRSPFSLEFRDEDRGKTVYFCLRWENTRGKKGPWGKIQSAIIP